MNNKFKRALSSILAFVMVFASITVMNVSSAMGADTFVEVWPNDSKNAALTTLTTDATYKANSMRMTTFSFSDGFVFTENETTGLAVETFGLTKVKRWANLKTFTVTPNTTGTFKLYTYVDSNDPCVPKVTANDGSAVTVALATIPKKGASSGDPLTFDVKSGVTYTITNDRTKGMHILAMGVVGTAAEQDSYKLTGSSNLTTVGDTFTLTAADGTAFTAKVVDASGNFEVSKSVDSGAASPFTAGDLTVSKKGYDATPATVTVAATADKLVYTATPAISFTEKVIPTIQVNPTDTGYTFTGLEGILTDDTAYGGAYATKDMVNGLYVDISGGKARLLDPGAGTTTLTMPLTAKVAGMTGGKVTFSGVLSDITADGSKWSVLDFGTAAIRISGNDKANTATDKMYSIAVPIVAADGTKTYNYYNTTIGTGTKELTYSITFDYDTDKVSLTLNGSTVETTITDMATVKQIESMTAGTAARPISVGDIKIDAVFPTVTTGENTATVVTAPVNTAAATAAGVPADKAVMRIVGKVAGLTADAVGFAFVKEADKATFEAAPSKEAAAATIEVTDVYADTYDATQFDASKLGADGSYTGATVGKLTDGGYFDAIVYGTAGQSILAYTYIVTGGKADFYDVNGALSVADVVLN